MHFTAGHLRRKKSFDCPWTYFSSAMPSWDLQVVRWVTKIQHLQGSPLSSSLIRRGRTRGEMGRLIWGQPNHTTATCLQAARAIKPAPPLLCQSSPSCDVSLQLRPISPNLAPTHWCKILLPHNPNIPLPAHPSHPPRACHTAVSMTAQMQRQQGWGAQRDEANSIQGVWGDRSAHWARERGEKRQYGSWAMCDKVRADPGHHN